MVQGLYEQGQITDGEFYQGLMVAGLQSGAKATVSLLPAAKVPGLLSSGGSMMLTAAKIGAVYGAADASVEVIGDRAMEDVLRLSSDRTILGDIKYVATQTAIGAGTGLAFGGITKGLLKIREVWNKSVISDGPFFLAPDAAPAPKILKTTVSSGVQLTVTPGKTTTILGSFKEDLRSVIKEVTGGLKSWDLGPKPGGFNVLNVPDGVYERWGTDLFWDTFNKPFLDEAIKRNDIIKLATNPVGKVIQNIDGSLTGFGKEIKYLLDKGYVYDSVTKEMFRK